MAHYVNMTSAAIAQIARALDEHEALLKKQHGQIDGEFQSLRQEGKWNDQNRDRFEAARILPLNDDFSVAYRMIQEMHPMLSHLYETLKNYEESAGY
jgi:predicted restriction endonuclease